MVGITYSVALFGVEGLVLQIEADAGNGFPQFEMVGLLSSEVREAKERVRTAIKNSGYELPCKKYMVNLSPANIRKAGNHFDLPIALALLTALGVVEKEVAAGFAIVGELSLEGRVCSIRGTLPLVYAAHEKGFAKCIVPKGNAREAALVTGMQVYAVETLEETVCFLQGKTSLQAVLPDMERYLQWEQLEQTIDFADINGQESMKRASLVACAGLHNLLMIGPPGSGKTMLARRIPTILPKMTMEEAMEVTKIHSVCGMLSQEQPMKLQRPFRSPHHTISAISLVGGGHVPHPGELSLAHRGVLFLDELPEFGKQALEVMRQPLEDRQVVISRTTGSYVFPTSVMLVAAMNPCNCGYYPDRTRCHCNDSDIHRYLGKISRPLLDRIDITIEIPSVSFQEMTKKQGNVSSKELRERVEMARAVQIKRYQGEAFQYNSQLGGQQIDTYCPLGKEEHAFMQQVFEHLELSSRGYHRLLKVARTIADLDGSEKITCTHLAEAVSYRSVDKAIWRNGS